MTTKYDAYACFDVSALRGSGAEIDDADEADGFEMRDAQPAPKLFLVVSAGGIELLSVPTLLH